MTAETVGRTCFTISKQFYFAFIAGKCYDNDHKVVDQGCFDIPAATAAYVSYYPSLNGFTLSSQFKGHPDLNNAFWTVAPKLKAGPGNLPYTFVGSKPCVEPAGGWTTGGGGHVRQCGTGYRTATECMVGCWNGDASILN